MFRMPLLILALLLITSHPAWAQKQLVDRVVAVVNDEAITQSELDFYLRPLYYELKKGSPDEDLMRQLNEARLKLLNQMIEDRLVLQEAKTRGITVEESEVDRMFNEVKKRFPSETEFENTLSSQGFSLTELRESQRRQLMIRKLHDMEIRAQVIVSPLEIEDDYKNHSSEFAEEEKVKVRSITIRKSEEAVEKGLTDDAAKKKIEGIEKRIWSGEDFGKLAKEFSEDAHSAEEGLVNWVQRGEMLSAIDAPLFKLKTGGISSILETPAGYHLFKVEEKKLGRIPPLSEVQGKIHEKLFRQKAEKRFNEWMQQLKSRAYISIR